MRHAPEPCPSCGKKLDAAECVSDASATPSPGDMTVCAHCTVPLVFDDELHMRLPTRAELDAAPPELTRAVKVMRRANYSAGAEGVLAAVRDWAKHHPGFVVQLHGQEDRVAYIGELSDVAHMFVGNEATAQLAAYVQRTVPNATWMMFRCAVEMVYPKN